MIINAVNCNFELNGRGVRAVFDAMHDELAKARPHLLVRQEDVDGEAKGGTLWDEADERLGLRVYPNPKTWTSVAIDKSVFRSVRGHDTGDYLPASARVLQLRQAGPDSLPFVASSAHLAYANPPLREIQAYEMTRLADKVMPIGQDQTPVKLPLLAAMDSNSFPEPGTPGDVALPTAQQITDKTHLIHRAREVEPGVWEMDTRPDRILRSNNLLEDAARYASTVLGQTDALVPTTYATTTHGPAARVDRWYLSRQLLPAVAFVKVIPVRKFSDHHIVVVGLDSDRLTEVLHGLVVQAKNNPLYAPVPA